MPPSPKERHRLLRLPVVRQVHARHQSADGQELRGQSERGSQEGPAGKAEQGHWPTKAPLGYRNITGPDGKKIIATDPALSPIVARLFEWYARGDISLKEAARKAHAAGLTLSQKRYRGTDEHSALHPAQSALCRLNSNGTGRT